MATASGVKMGGMALVVATNVRAIVTEAVNGYREVAQHVVMASLVQRVIKSAQGIVKMPFVFLTILIDLNVLPVKMATTQKHVPPHVQSAATLDVISTIGIAMHVK